MTSVLDMQYTLADAILSSTGKKTQAAVYSQK